MYRQSDFLITKISTKTFRRIGQPSEKMERNVFLKGSRNYEIAELVKSNYGFYPSYPKTGSFEFPVNHTEKVWISGREIHVDGFGIIDITTGKPTLNA